MNNKAMTLSLVMAVLAIFFVQSYVSSLEDEQKKKFGSEVVVVFAKNNIKEMDTINETMLEVKAIPDRFKDPNAVPYEKVEKDEKSGKSFGRGLKEWAGYIALVPIKAGEQITYTKISEPNVRTGLAPQITPGRRAIAISVNDRTAVAKLVKPGDRVDLIGVVDLGGGKANKIAKILLQDVVVLATGKNINNNAARLVETDSITNKPKIQSLAEDTQFSSVTLEVDPVQAEMMVLVLAGGDTSLSLALRNNDDTDRTPVATMNYNDVIGLDLSKTRAPAGTK
jgi:pilus assembly protein CpaB